MASGKQKKRAVTSRTLYYFWQALWAYKWRVIILTVLIPIYVFLGHVLVPKGASEIIGLLSEGNLEFSDYVGSLLLALLPAALDNIIIMRFLDWLDWSLDAKGGEYLSKLSFNAVINQSMTFHSNRFSGSLTSAANKLPGAFINFKSSVVWDVYPLILLVIYSIGTAFVVCPPFAALLIVFALAFSGVAVGLYRRSAKAENDLSEAENKQTGQLADAITNEMSVKSYARESFERARFARATKRTHDATFGVAKASFMRNLPLNTVGTLTYVGLIFLIVMSHKWFNLSVADAVFLYTITTTLMDHLWGLPHILRTMNRAFGDAKEMTEILDLPYIVDDKTDKPLAISEAKIEFQHVNFSHEKQKEKLFTDFCLTIPSGKSVGLVGVSGSGKSTLTKLLLRFDDVKAGAIYIDGQDIRDVTQNSLREAIAYVPQESSLFHRSIYENIAYGRPEATKTEVLRAAKLANADDFIQKMPDKYETLVGERGVKLSGGQRQRIAIARAILKNAPILVLDEATSALDSESEAAIQEALVRLMRGRTSIVVAHRLSTIAGLDEIVVLDDGKIVEQGTHAELLKADGEYAKLWSRQSGAFLDEN